MRFYVDYEYSRDEFIKFFKSKIDPEDSYMEILSPRACIELDCDALFCFDTRLSFIPAAHGGWFIDIIAGREFSIWFFKRMFIEAFKQTACLVESDKYMYVK